jgi:S1-C subfamily serine protease
MNRALTTVVVLVVGGGAAAGTLAWRARRTPASVAVRVTGAPTALSANASAGAAPSDTNSLATASATAPDRAAIASDVAARVAAAMAAAKAKADAETLVATSTPPSELPLEELISRSLPAVVRIETSGSLGTGFFIAPDTILTNVHVVASNTSVTVRRADGTTVSGRVDATATELDIAIVHVSSPSPNQTTLRMGSAGQVRAGQEVIALGSPLGLQNTVTRGIVSAVREVGGLTLVQTDAAINPGNSGGPLMDRTGRVIGITTMAMRSDVAQGLSFAVGIEHAQSLLAGKRPTGATGTPLTTLNQAMSNTPSASGADASRDRATQTYERAVATTARSADALDDRWRSFVRNCYAGQIVGTFDHPWFALWDTRAMQGAVSSGCDGAFADIRRVADDIRSTIIALEEAARQADVYPGTRRDVLRRYRLDNPAWTR